MQLQNRISAPKPKRDNFEAPFERNFERKIVSANITKKNVAKSPSQPWCSHDLRLPAAKDKTITCPAAAARNLDAAITRSCKTIARRKQETKNQLGTFRATARVSAPVAQARQFISATERPHTWKKHTVSRKSWHSNLILDVAVPRRSGNSELHSLLQKQKRIATHYSITSSFWRNLTHQPAANNQWWSPTEQIRTCTIEKSSEEYGESYDGWPILHDQTSHIQDHTSPKQQRRWQEICKQRHNTAWTSWSIYYVTFELRNTTNKKCTQQSRHKASAHATSMCTQTLIGQVAQQQGSPQAGSQWRYWVPQYTLEAETQTIISTS